MDKKRIEEIALKKASDFIIDAVGEGNLINFVIDVIEAVQGEAVPVGYIDAKDLAKSGNSRIIAKCLGPYAGLTTPLFTAPPAAPAVHEGWKLVPIVPFEEQLDAVEARYHEVKKDDAFYKYNRECKRQDYIAAVSAAPAPEVK